MQNKKQLHQKYPFAYESEDIIFGFFGKYFFLSNFYLTDIEYYIPQCNHSFVFPSSEHIYMLQKSVNYQVHYPSLSQQEIDNYNGNEYPFLNEKKSIFIDGENVVDLLKKSPAEIKKWGSKTALRDNWDAIRLHVIHDAVLEKFRQNKDLAQRLIDTGNKKLVEANNWCDTFWGFDVNNQKGKNWLGRTLELVRSSLVYF